MKKGKLISKGMTAEVYEWGRDKVLKLFFSRIIEDWIKYEAQIERAVNKAGIKSPKVFDLIDEDGRKGIILERIYGKSMQAKIQAEPWNTYLFTKQLANAHFNIHKYSVNELPSQKDKFLFLIKSSYKLPVAKQNRILEYIEGLPDGKRVCHGDFHFNNIIVSKNGLVAIDWSNAYQGNPLGDVARTYLMLTSPSAPIGAPGFIKIFSQSVKWSIGWSYLSEYMKIAKVGFDEIDAWILPVAAAKLRDKIPGEDKWLLEIINTRLGMMKK